MYDQPYLETCCRSALHRLKLSGEVARPPGLKDGQCLERLAAMGLAAVQPDGALRHHRIRRCPPRAGDCGVAALKRRAGRSGA